MTLGLARNVIGRPDPIETLCEGTEKVRESKMKLFVQQYN